MTPEELRARVLHRDRQVIVLDKPAGLPVHAGPKGGANLEAMLAAVSFGLPQPPGLAHRLDQDTSGCLVLGRDARALRRLGRLFQAGRVHKTYWAITEGVPEPVAGRIDLPLAKHSAQRGWWMRVDRAGRPAVTDYRVLAASGGRAWVELIPRTGRTHQIRVHLAAIGCPVRGDPIYGRDRGGRLLLHARAVGIPLGEPPIEVRAPPPPAFERALRELGLA
jgi:tRNA pseudouridine32 synthase / 23S rRNA pseudouridine746 synthase